MENELVYSNDYNILQEPLKYFTKFIRGRFDPTKCVIITGKGFLLSYEIPHECDCDLCEVATEQESQVFTDEKSMTKFIKDLEHEHGYDFDVLNTKEVYYAKIVEQKFD